MTDEEDARVNLDIRYRDLLDEIRDALSKYSLHPFFRYPLEDLQRTIVSMKSIVKDLKQSEIASSQYIFMTTEFLPQIEDAIDEINRFLLLELPAVSSWFDILKFGICRFFMMESLALTTVAVSNKKELENVRKNLRDVFKEYVENELAMLDQSDQSHQAEEAEQKRLLQELLTHLLWKIRDIETYITTLRPIFRKIQIILNFIQVELIDTGQFSIPSSSMHELLRLLKELKLLIRFLNGDHGLEIQSRLWEREYALRRFVPISVKLRLQKIDRNNEWYYQKELREKSIWNSIMWLVISTALLVSNISEPDFRISKVPSDCAIFILLIIFVVSSAYNLVMQLYTHVRLGRSPPQRQRSNAINPHNSDMMPHSKTTDILDNNTNGADLISTNSKERRENVSAIPPSKTAFAETKRHHTSGPGLNSTSSNDQKSYEIFLNFRGGDIRTTIPGLLHDNLEALNISTFYDEESATYGQKIWEEIESAISTSVGAITILSENYCDSEDCLNELVLILERQKALQKDFMLMPIFYDVKVEDLTDPESRFFQRLLTHNNTSREPNVIKWKQTLAALTSFKGKVYNSNSTEAHQSKLIKGVVQAVTNHMRTTRVADDNTITLED